MESYQFNKLTESATSKELSRLEMQARMFWDKEYKLLSELGLDKFSNGVDIGCGPGFISKAIAESFPKLQLIGLDISPELISIAERNASNIKNLSFKVASALETNLPDESQDFVYSRLVYQYLSEPIKAAEEAFRICKSGGKIAILDIDASLKVFSELLPVTQSLLKEITLQQKIQGGDREIGSRLDKILKEANFKSVVVNTVEITTTDIAFKDFWDLTMSFAEWVCCNEKIRLLYESALMEIENAGFDIFGKLPVFFTHGTKE